MGSLLLVFNENNKPETNQAGTDAFFSLSQKRPTVSACTKAAVDWLITTPASFLLFT